MKEISTLKAPVAIGPYSQAIDTGSLVFVSGQIPVDPKTGKFASTKIEGQTIQSLENIKAILNEAGLDMKDVVKTTVYLKDINDFAAMNEEYANFFSKPYPARAAFEVVNLPKGALVEIECVASKK